MFRPQLVAVLALLAVACGDESAERDAVPAPLERVAVPPTDDLSSLEELAHLGYVDFGEPDAETRSGVVLHERGLAAPGYTLITSLTNSRATLVDMDGTELRVWEDPELSDTRWSRAAILRNGDVLCVSPKADVLTRLSFEGELVWRRPLEVHHDGLELPDGRILVLTRRFRVIPDIDAERRCVDNLLTLLSSSGEVLAEHSLYDLLQAEPRLLQVERPPGLESLPPGYNIDPIHANTVFWLEDPALARVNPLFEPGRVLVTLRYLDAVALFDLEEARCVWAWGAGELEGPHDASILADGHVLLLDNGYETRGWSRVVEMDPLSGAIVWEYRAPEPKSFYTSGRGTVQALPNGNVLVGNSNSGEAFEVTRDGKIVWRWLNPLRDEQGARGVIRAERYEAERLRAWLERGAAPR